MDIRGKEEEGKKCNQLKSSRLIPTIFFSSFTFHFATLSHHIFFATLAMLFSLSHCCSRMFASNINFRLKKYRKKLEEENATH